MKDDFRAKRWPLRLLAGLMLIVIACKATEGTRLTQLDVTDHETRVAEIEKIPPENRSNMTVEEYERLKLVIELTNLENMRAKIEYGEYKPDPLLTKSENLKRALDRERTPAPVPRSLDDRIDQIRRELGPPYFIVEDPVMQAQATDIPPALYVDEPVDPIQKGTPIQFSMEFEHEYPHDYCPPGRGRISMTLWNVGAQGGTNYASVECAEWLVPFFHYDSGEKMCINVNDYAVDWPHVCHALTFTGGPNGKILMSGELSDNKGVQEIGRFINGRTLKFFDSEIPVPDPSVFAGMQ